MPRGCEEIYQRSPDHLDQQPFEFLSRKMAATAKATRPPSRENQRRDTHLPQPKKTKTRREDFVDNKNDGHYRKHATSPELSTLRTEKKKTPHRLCVDSAEIHTDTDQERESGKINNHKTNNYNEQPTAIRPHTPPPTPPTCLLYTSPSPRDLSTSRMPSSA